MNKRILTIAVLIGIVAVGIYNIQGTSSRMEEGYREGIEIDRKTKDQDFKVSDESPLTDQQKEDFSALTYFPVSEKYRIEAEFQRNSREQVVKIAITDGSQREYYVFGHAHFHLDGKELDLTVYKPVRSNSDYLFIPFYDVTSADLTYGGGRYVEPILLEGGKIEIDFNLAYNPYCAYNHTYRCPIPPQDNNLNVSILAGEKIPEFIH